jgi:hypothetical protein
MNRLIILLFPLSLMAETSGNLLSQDFTNGWTGTNQSSRHGTSTIAGVDGGNVESTISLSDTLNASQINGGWTSTLGADIWSWNNNDQTTTMSQIITGADGTVTTQVRNISTTSSDNYTSYTDSYTQGINSQSDYDITVRFSFDESSNSIYHYATDLKNPILTIEYSLLDTTQVAELKTMSETVYNAVEDIEFYEYIPEEEFTFEIIEQPMIEISTIEEFYFEPQAIEELNAGVVDVFQEITYDSTTNFEEVSTEIKVEEVFFETGESFDTTQANGIIQEFFSEEIYETPIEIKQEEVYEERETDIQTSDASGITEREPIQQETSGRESEEVNGVEDTGGGDGNSPRENEGGITRESGENSTVAENSNDENSNETVSPETISDSDSTEDTTVAEEVDEPVGEGEAGGSESGNERTEVADSGEETLESRDTEVEESGTEGTTRVSNQAITVESIERKVNETLTRIDQRLVATSLIVARAMESPLSMDNYGNTNDNIFNNQLNIDGGEYYDQRQYIDARNIYAQSQVTYNDPVAKSQKILQESIDNRIRAEEHLKRIRGY